MNMYQFPFAILSKFCSFSIFSSTEAASASTYLLIRELLLSKFAALLSARGMVLFAIYYR